MVTLFETGQIGATPAALEALGEEGIKAAILRHIQGDWGDLCEEDAAENVRSLDINARILSKYQTPDGDSFYVITEADRSSTTVLLTHEY